MLLCSEKTYSSHDQVRLLYARFFLVFEPEIRQSEFLPLASFESTKIQFGRECAKSKVRFTF